MMKVVIAHRSGQPQVVELPEPRLAPGYVLVRVSHSAVILPDELHQIERAPRLVPKNRDGVPLGSCASGTIMEVGSEVRTLKAGLRVAVTGNPFVYHGSMLVVPEAYAVELPKKVNHEEGSYGGLGASAIHMLRIGDVQIGEVVLVFGADMLGLIVAQAVRAGGATPILVDESDFRLNRAKALGVSHLYQPDDPDLVQDIDQLTNGNGVDTAIITRTGDALAFNAAMHLLRNSGTLVMGALAGGKVKLDLIYEKEITLRPATGFLSTDNFKTGSGTSARWTVRDNMGCFCNLLADRKIQISSLVTDRIPIERATTVYEKASRGRDAVLGVVLTT